MRTQVNPHRETSLVQAEPVQIETRRETAVSTVTLEQLAQRQTATEQQVKQTHALLEQLLTRLAGQNAGDQVAPSATIESQEPAEERTPVSAWAPKRPQVSRSKLREFFD